MITFTKDPDAVLDYLWDWTTWLASEETISSHTITVSDETDGAVVVDSSTETAGVITVWLSGGVAGTNYYATCRINTNQGRTDDRTIKISCKDR